MSSEEFSILKYTVQLYFHSRSKTSHPIQIASGILIKGTSKYFMLICKHVFDNISPEDVFILTSEGFAVRLPDKVKFINNDIDSIDLALVEMKDERLWELNEHYSFLPKRDLGLDHIFDEDLFYMLFGFINKRTTRKNVEFYVESFGYLST